MDVTFDHVIVLVNDLPLATRDYAGSIASLGRCCGAAASR